jgi:hypothetical protein
MKNTSAWPDLAKLRRGAGGLRPGVKSHKTLRVGDRLRMPGANFAVEITGFVAAGDGVIEKAACKVIRSDYMHAGPREIGVDRLMHDYLPELAEAGPPPPGAVPLSEWDGDRLSVWPSQQEALLAEFPHLRRHVDGAKEPKPWICSLLRVRDEGHEVVAIIACLRVSPKMSYHYLSTRRDGAWADSGRSGGRGTPFNSEAEAKARMRAIIGGPR